MNLRTKLDKVMEEMGYGDIVKDKTDQEVIHMIEEEFVPLDEIDETQPFEMIKYDIYDTFWEKHWIQLTHLVSEDKAKRLYDLLCDYKRQARK